MVGSMYEEARKAGSWKRPPGDWAERINVKRWMRKWHDSFALLGVEVVVADVAQSCVVVDVAARTIILAPWLKLMDAEKILHKVYAWWRHQSASVEGQLCSFLSC